MKKILHNYFRLLRPRQWIKNLAIFAAITFTGTLFDLLMFEKVFYGFLVFCAASSAIYIINDIFDIKKDKLHPFKRFRPLAHGDISISVSLIIASVLAAVAITGSFFIEPAFFLITIVYFIL